MGDKCVIKKCKQLELRLLQFVHMLLIFIMNKNVPLHPKSSYYQMCISKRQKKVILLLILSGNPNQLLDLKQYHSLEQAETKFLQLSLWSKNLALELKEIKIRHLS